MSDEQDWRLQAELDAPDTRGALDRLLGRVRGPDIVREVGAAVPHDVAITHDGELLFAYAVSEAEMAAARSAIEGVLQRDGVSASIRISHFDQQQDRWRQTDPPLSAAEQRVDEAAVRDAEAIETRTMVASAGKLVRASFDQSMLEWAQKLGLECKIAEHPQLLTTQVAFTVTGPKRKIDEFAEGLRAEEVTTVRSEGVALLSPL
jgi:hypothetical protein